MFPSKVISIQDSLIWKLPIVLRILENENFTIENLLIETRPEFDDIDEFILAIDILYILDKISVDEKYGVIKKC